MIIRFRLAYGNFFAAAKKINANTDNIGNFVLIEKKSMQDYITDNRASQSNSIGSILESTNVCTLTRKYTCVLVEQGKT